jgi:hypothetical protein
LGGWDKSILSLRPAWVKQGDTVSAKQNNNNNNNNKTQCPQTKNLLGTVGENTHLLSKIPTIQWHAKIKITPLYQHIDYHCGAGDGTSTSCLVDKHSAIELHPYPAHLLCKMCVDFYAQFHISGVICWGIYNMLDSLVL